MSQVAHLLHSSEHEGRYQFLDELGAWFAEAVGHPLTHHRSDPWAPGPSRYDRKVRCQLCLDPLGEGPGPPIPPPAPLNGEEYIVALCHTTQLSEPVADGGVKPRTLLLWAAGTFPGRRPGEWLQCAVSLCLLSPGPLPPPQLADAETLSCMLADSCKYGASGMTLQWPGHAPRSLDILPPRNHGATLELWDFLPPESPTSPAENSWSPSLSWLGLIPTSFPLPKEQAVFSTRDRKFRTEFTSRVSRLILDCQRAAWATASAMIVQAWRLAKKRALEPAPAEDEDQPAFFARIATLGQSPASTIYTGVSKYLEGAKKPDRVTFLAACPGLGIPLPDRELAWLVACSGIAEPAPPSPNTRAWTPPVLPAVLVLDPVPYTI